MKVATDEAPAVLGVVTVPGMPRAVQAVRRFAMELLTERPFRDDLVLCLSELVTNAVVHTASGRGGHVTVAITEGGEGVQVDVSDDGGTGVPEICHEAEGVSGRGLRLVEGLAGSWGVRVSREGTTVWFTMDR
ncbi:ATP-binding protein [Spirillospora sp. NPDC048911]|uniref:ATP-binding protein n=1 Tax=Spirillospora sp. NPDC048911 TaxID=3364527 RepID=UPI0037210FB5